MDLRVILVQTGGGLGSFAGLARRSFLISINILRQEDKDGTAHANEQITLAPTAVRQDRTKASVVTPIRGAHATPFLSSPLHKASQERTRDIAANSRGSFPPCRRRIARRLGIKGRSARLHSADRLRPSHHRAGTRPPCPTRPQRESVTPPGRQGAHAGADTESPGESHERSLATGAQHRPHPWPMAHDDAYGS